MMMGQEGNQQMLLSDGLEFKSSLDGSLEDNLNTMSSFGLVPEASAEGRPWPPLPVKRETIMSDEMMRGNVLMANPVAMDISSPSALSTPPVPYVPPPARLPPAESEKLFPLMFTPPLFHDTNIDT